MREHGGAVAQRLRGQCGARPSDLAVARPPPPPRNPRQGRLGVRIATGLRPRNDEEVWAGASAWGLDGYRKLDGRVMTLPYRVEGENLEKAVDNSKIHVKICSILQRDTKKKQCKPG